MKVEENKKQAVQYTGMRDVAKKIYRNEGVAGFYKGLTPNLIKVFPSSGLFFLSYECTLLLFADSKISD